MCMYVCLSVCMRICTCLSVCLYGCIHGCMYVSKIYYIRCMCEEDEETRRANRFAQSISCCIFLASIIVPRLFLSFVPERPLRSQLWVHVHDCEPTQLPQRQRCTCQFSPASYEQSLGEQTRCKRPDRVLRVCICVCVCDGTTTHTHEHVPCARGRGGAWNRTL